MSWEDVQLEELINLKRGYDLPKRLREKGRIPIISSAGITDYHSEFKCNDHGVVTGRYGTLGEVYYSSEPYWPLNTTFYVQDFRGNNPKFIYFLLKTLKLEEYNGAAAVPGLDRKVLHKIRCKAPPLPTQKKIAGILSAYDDLIENNLKRIKLLEEAAQNIYREWFVHFRYPGHEDVLINKETGLPEGWERKPIGFVCNDKRNTIKPQDFLSEDIYVGLEHIPRKSTTLNNWGNPEDVTSNKFGFLKYDILFGKIRPYFHKVSVAPQKGIASSDTIIIYPLKPMFFGFLLQVVSSSEFVEFSHKTCKEGANMPRANWKVMRTYEVSIPKPLLMEKFNSLVLAFVDEAILLTKSNISLKEARDILLPRLMNQTIEV